MTQTLPYRWYTDPDVLARERERLFAPAWQYAGHRGGSRSRARTSPAARATSRSSSCATATASCARSSTCAATAAPRSISGAGRCTTLQCHYHAWTYGLDGALRAAPRSDADPEFDRAGARPAAGRASTPGGRSSSSTPTPTPPPLADTLGRSAADRRATAASTSTRSRSTTACHYALDANWKVAIENYLECYHCAVAHPSVQRRHRRRPRARTGSSAIRPSPATTRARATGDGAGEPSGQFHLVWPTHQGQRDARAGRTCRSARSCRSRRARTDGFLDYFFAPDADAGVDRRLPGARRPGRRRGPRAGGVRPARDGVGRVRARAADAPERGADRRLPALGGGRPGSDAVARERAAPTCASRPARRPRRRPGAG